MVARERGGYASRLASGHLSYQFINKILPFFDQHFKILPVQPDAILRFKPELSIDTTLSRHPLYVALGHKVWSGLVVGFPGNIEELSTTHVSTPYLRKILYPLLNLHQHLQKSSPDPLRCLYLVGDRFSDVFLRKFRLLELITPHIVVLTGDLAKAKTKPADPAQLTTFNEAWAQAWLSQKLQSQDGLLIPTSDGRSVRGGFIANELPTGEGTRNPERLDILAYDRADKSLIALEIKGPGFSTFYFLFLRTAIDSPPTP